MEITIQKDVITKSGGVPLSKFIAKYGLTLNISCFSNTSFPPIEVGKQSNVQVTDEDGNVTQGTQTKFVPKVVNITEEQIKDVEGLAERIQAVVINAINSIDG
jgi:hypothetical protein